MKFKVFNIEFDGIDKVGKDTVMKQIFSMAPNKYIPKARGIMSQIAYSALNNRNYEYEIKKIYKQIDDINLKKNKLLDFLISEVVSREEYEML